MDITNLPFTSKYSFLPQVLRAMEEASEEILKVYVKDFTSEEKADKSPITEADTISNTILMNRLKQTGIPVLSEEDEDSVSLIGSKMVWIIDPLDGTKDFISKNDQFCIMVGLIENNVCVLGCILEPATGIMTVAEKTKGAYRSNKNLWEQLKVNTNKEMSAYTAVTSRNHLSDNERLILEKLNIAERKPHGSCGLKIIQVGCGNAEMYFTTTNRIKQWDTAAGSIIIQEAGGEITDSCGNLLKFNEFPINHERGILVSNGLNHSKISLIIDDLFSSD